MLLAEGAETSAGQWGTLFTLVSGGVVGIIVMIRNSIKENHREEQKIAREDRREQEKMQVQIEQRDVLRQLEHGQTVQNGKLDQSIAVSKEYHTEVLHALQFTCKAAGTVIVNNPPRKEE